MSNEIEVAILGSCVTRDAFEFPESNKFEVVHYSARTGLGSFLGPATDGFTGDVESIPSAFQRRMVAYDVTKFGRNWLRRENFDVLVYDPIDERFPLIQFGDGGIATLSNEFRAMPQDDLEFRTVTAWSQEHFMRWHAGWRTFIRLLDEIGCRDRLVVHLATWSERVEGSEEPPTAIRHIETANAWLARAEEVMRADLAEDQFIRVRDEHQLADGEHKWGISPFHYVRPYYDDFLEQLERFAQSRGRRRPPEEVEQDKAAEVLA